MRLTFLGTGGVWAAPVHGCFCRACAAARTDPSRARAPASALLEVAGLRLLIDAGRTDLVDRFPPSSLDGVLLTHFHADHCLGLTLMRWSLAEPLPVWHPHDPRGYDDLTKHPGRLRFQTCAAGGAFCIGPVTVTPVTLTHSRPTLGWVIAHGAHRIAYLSDTRGLSVDTHAILDDAPLDLVVLDCAYPPGVPGPRNHNDLDEAAEILARLAPRLALLTHINHDLDEYSAGSIGDLGFANEGATVVIDE
ncbi:Phosphoribosyl 1,2-cyclic phosphate phosphodiesterase [Frigidibacter albus]